MDHSSLQSLGEKIRSLRKQHGISQSTMADIAGVSLPSITRLEGGKETIRLDVVTRVLDCLGYEIDIRPKSPAQSDLNE